MTFNKVLMDFSNVRKIERTAEFTHNSHRYMCCVSVNPNNNNVLFSLFLDRKPVVLNRVVIVGEGLVDGFGVYDFSDVLEGDFVFMPLSAGYAIGNVANYEDLGTALFLYHVLEDGENEN